MAAHGYCLVSRSYVKKKKKGYVKKDCIDLFKKPVLKGRREMK